MSEMGPENVADAYIQVHADTEAFRRELRGRLANEMAQYTRKMQKTFGQRVKIAQKEEVTAFVAELSKVANTGDWSKLHNQYKDTGKWAEVLEERIRGLRSSMEGVAGAGGIGKAMFISQADINALMTSLGKYKEMVKVDDDLRAITRRNQAWSDQLRTLKTITPEVEHMAFVLKDLNSKLGEADRKNLGVAEAAWDKYVRSVRTGLAQISALQVRHEREMKRLAEQTIVQSRGYSVFFDRLKSSRSELIHGIGVAMDIFATVVGKTVEGTLSALNRLREYFSPGGGGLGKMITDFGVSAGQAFALLSKSWPALVATVVALALAFQAMGLALGTTVALASGLLGILVGLASSLGMTLAAIIPLAGALTGAAYGITLLVASLKDMKKYLPGASAALDNLKRAFSEVDVRAFAEGVNGPLKDLFNTLADSLKNDSVAGALGRAFGGITTSLADVVRSPAWKAFMQALETTIPRGIEGMGRGVSGVLSGLMSMFASAGPAAERLGQSFQRFGDNFAATMERMRGDGSLGRFFDVAAESMETVLGLAWSVGEALAGLFEAAAPGGNDMLKSLTEIVDKFTEWVTSTEGKNQIAEWMAFAKEVAGELSDMVKEVGAVLRQLDTPENRQFALNLINAISGLMTFFLALAGGAGMAAGEIEKFRLKIGPWFDQLREDASEAGAAISGFFASVGDGVRGMWGNILAAWNGISWSTLGSDIVAGFTSGVSAGWDAVVASVRENFQRIVTAVKDLFGIASPSTVFAQIGRDVIAGFISGVVGAAAGVATAVRTALAGLPTTVSGIFSTIGTSATTAWSALSKSATSTWKGIAATITTSMESAQRTVSSTWSTISSTVTERLRVIGSVMAASWSNLRSGAEGAWSTIRATISGALSSIASTVASSVGRFTAPISTAWSNVWRITGTAWHNVRTTVMAGVSGAVSVIAGLPSRAAGALGSIGGVLVGAGQRLISGFIRGIEAMFGSVRATLASLTRRLTDWKGPADRDRRLLEGAGRLVIQGFIRGMESQYGVAQRSLGAFTGALGIAGTALPAGAAYANNSRTINVAPGAIQVSSRASDPRIVAGMILDDMAVRMIGG